MKVVCPYTTVHPFCERALARWAPDTEMVDLGSRHDAYHGLLDGLWRAGATFLVVEHDIEIHEQVIPQLVDCDEQWCVFPYHVADTLLDGSLGCTRFGVELLAALPSFMTDLPVRDWRRLDCEMTPRLHWAGWTQHVHQPLVLHHHRRENGRCDCRGDHQ